MRKSLQMDQCAAKSSNMDDYIDNILAENLTLKRTLDSKGEALVILNAEVSKLNFERERLKSIIEDLKRRQPSLTSDSELPSAECTRALRSQVDILRQKLRDAMGDVQALRAKLNQDKPSAAPYENETIRREEELVEQLEQMQRCKALLEADLQVVLDEKEELVTERDAYKCKLHRLNHECNVLLKGNGKGIIDLDALVMENRFLQERLMHLQEECKLTKHTCDKYKNLIQTSKNKGTNNGISADGNGGMLLSQKQVKELLETYGRTEVPGIDSIASTSELRSLCLTLLDSLGDKTLALTHQKRANRILAANIGELQSRVEVFQSEQWQSPSSALLEGYKRLEDSEQQHILVIPRKE